MAYLRCKWRQTNDAPHPAPDLGRNGRYGATVAASRWLAHRQLCAVSGHFQDLDRAGGIRRTDRSAVALRGLQKRLDGPTTVLADCRSAHAQQSGGPMEKCGWRRVIAYYDLGSFCSVAANLTIPLSADGHCCFLRSWPLASPHRRSGAITPVG